MAPSRGGLFGGGGGISKIEKIRVEPKQLQYWPKKQVAYKKNIVYFHPQLAILIYISYSYFLSNILYLQQKYFRLVTFKFRWIIQYENIWLFPKGYISLS